MTISVTVSEPFISLKAKPAIGISPKPGIFFSLEFCSTCNSPPIIIGLPEGVLTFVLTIFSDVGGKTPLVTPPDPCFDTCAFTSIVIIPSPDTFPFILSNNPDVISLIEPYKGLPFESSVLSIYLNVFVF